MTIERYENWGKCGAEGCVSHFVPRCKSAYCERCCDKLHVYWLGHIRVNGQPNSVTLKARQAALPVRSPLTPYSQVELDAIAARAEDLAITRAALPPAKPLIPEPGTLKDVTAEESIFVVVESNSYSWSKERHIPSGFPIVYIP